MSADKPDLQTKKCSKCHLPGGSPLPGSDAPSGFSPRAEGSGLASMCRECNNARNRKKYEEAAARRNSEYAAMKPEDFDVSVGNEGPKDGAAAAEKRQDYNRKMGETADGLASSGGDPDLMDPDLGSYIGKLAEQERRFGNRRMARSVSLSVAHEALALRQFKQAAAEHLAGKVEPTGYALDMSGRVAAKRDVVLVLSDLHFGAELDAASNPIPYRSVEEARRFEYVIRQALDYKPQYRQHSRLRVLLNGDLIEGMLMHDWRAGAPLTEQKVVFWKYLSAAMGLFAQQYPEVLVECQPGNHGRDKLRHPGRATEFKWDGVEWQMYYALMMMCSDLRNVKWSLPFRAVSVLDLYGAKALVSHGDTEVPIGDPDTQAPKNALMLERINASREYGCEFEVAIFGHYHKSRNQGGHVIKIFNACLVPPNGHARGKGYVNEPCSQTIFEAVEGHPVGDYRRIEVGPAQDHDERLGTLIKPFRFDLNNPRANAAVMP